MIEPQDTQNVYVCRRGMFGAVVEGGDTRCVFSCWMGGDDWWGGVVMNTKKC